MRARHRESTAAETHLIRLGRWIAGLDATHVPAAVVRAARYQVLDMIAAGHAGARSPAAASVIEGMEGFAGAGRATVLANGRRFAPGDAALANAACSMAHDFDDIVWMGHTCHSAVFASLAVAEHEGANAADLLLAIVVANEIGGRIGASSILGPLNGQMWTFIHLAGAAAATAKLLRLDAERTTHALAIALSQPNFALQPGFLAPTSKLLAAATPTQAGIQAAYFARAGMSGAPDILEDARGFWRRFAYLPLPAMLGGLGELWTTGSLTLKTYPGCHYFQTACTAIDEIRSRRGPLRLEDVRRVRIDTTKLGAEATRFAREYAPAEGGVTSVNVNFDLATTAAILLATGRLGPEELAPAWLDAHAADILRWRERVTVHHDPALTAKVLASASRVAAWRASLARLGARDLANLVRRYRDDYRSTLFSAADVLGWLKLGGRRLVRRRRDRTEPAQVEGLPLLFPNRVTIELANGQIERAEVDLPVGSLAAPRVEQELARKFLAATSPALGEARAREMLAAGLRMESASLDDLVRLASVNP